MKRSTVIVVLKAKHSELKIACILKDLLLSIVKVHKELETEDGDSTAITKCKTPINNPNTIKTPKFI